MNPYEGQSTGWRSDPDVARAIGRQNYFKSFLPPSDLAPILEAAGIPARGPVARWTPRIQRDQRAANYWQSAREQGLRVPDDLYRTGRSLFFGKMYRPRSFESRWLGGDMERGAMRSPDPERVRIGDQMRTVQPLHVEIYGAPRRPGPPQGFYDPAYGTVGQALRAGNEARRELYSSPAWMDSFQRVDPHVLWGLDQPGRYGVQRPWFRE